MGGKQLVVPIGSNFDRIQRLPIDKIRRHRLVYMGSLRQGQGIGLVIEALPKIRKVIRDIELLVVGFGPLGQELSNRARQLGLQDCVTFTGQIADHRDLERTLCSCGVGLAPYEPTANGFTQYTEPGKVKVYMACGLPVIITRVPAIAREVEKVGAGISITYDVGELASSVEKLFSDDAAYASMRAAAISFASQYSWTRIFNAAFDDMF